MIRSHRLVAVSPRVASVLDPTTVLTNAGCSHVRHMLDPALTSTR